MPFDASGRIFSGPAKKNKPLLLIEQMISDIAAGKDQRFYVSEHGEFWLQRQGELTNLSLLVQHANFEYLRLTQQQLANLLPMITPRLGLTPWYAGWGDPEHMLQPCSLLPENAYQQQPVTILEARCIYEYTLDSHFAELSYPLYRIINRFTKGCPLPAVCSHDVKAIFLFTLMIYSAANKLNSHDLVSDKTPVWLYRFDRDNSGSLACAMRNNRSFKTQQLLSFTEKDHWRPGIQANSTVVRLRSSRSSMINAISAYGGDGHDAEREHIFVGTSLHKHTYVGGYQHKTEAKTITIPTYDCHLVSGMSCDREMLYFYQLAMRQSFGLLRFPYSEEDICEQDFDPVAGVERPNHGFLHHLRQSYYVDAIVNYFAQHAKNPELRKLCQNLTDFDVYMLKITLMYATVGRQSDVSRRDNPQAYERYRATSATFCSQFILFQMRLSREQADYYATLITMSWDEALKQIRSLSDGDSCPHQLCLKLLYQFARLVDLPRCFDALQYDAALAIFASRELVHVSAQQDKDFAAIGEQAFRAIYACGDRLMFGRYGYEQQDYSLEIFAKYSNSAILANQLLQAVFDNNILAQLAHDSIKPSDYFTILKQLLDDKSCIRVLPVPQWISVMNHLLKLERDHARAFYRHMTVETWLILVGKVAGHIRLSQSMVLLTVRLCFRADNIDLFAEFVPKFSHYDSEADKVTQAQIATMVTVTQYKQWVSFLFRCQQARVLFGISTVYFPDELTMKLLRELSDATFSREYLDVAVQHGLTCYKRLLAGHEQAQQKYDHCLMYMVANVYFKLSGVVRADLLLQLSDACNAKELLLLISKLHTDEHVYDTCTSTEHEWLLKHLLLILTTEAGIRSLTHQFAWVDSAMKVTMCEQSLIVLEVIDKHRQDAPRVRLLVEVLSKHILQMARECYRRNDLWRLIKAVAVVAAVDVFAALIEDLERDPAQHVFIQYYPDDERFRQLARILSDRSIDAKCKVMLFEYGQKLLSGSDALLHALSILSASGKRSTATLVKHSVVTGAEQASGLVLASEPDHAVAKPVAFSS